ncbi:uncharacterized protein RBU57_017819 [Macrochelys suwanniensis]
MAYRFLLKKSIVTLCKKKGIHIGKLTKAQLITRLEEDDHSREQIPDPNGATAGSGSSWSDSLASPRVWSPTRWGSSRSGSPAGDRRRMGLELSPREQEDGERQQEPEKDLPKKQQQQRELAVVERRGIGDWPGVSGDRSRGASSAGDLDPKLLPLVKEGGDVEAHLTALEQAGDWNQGDPAEKPRDLTPLLGPKAINSASQMGGMVDRFPLLALDSNPMDPQWERKVMVNGETFGGWQDPGTERTVVRPRVVHPHQMLRGCVTWVRVPGTDPFALPMAQIPVQTQEGSGWLVVGVLQDISCEVLLGGDCVSLGQDPGPGPVTAEDLNLNSGNQLAKREMVSENANDLAGRGEELPGPGYLPACNQTPRAGWDREMLPTPLHNGEVAQVVSDAESKAASSLPGPTGTARAALSTGGAETPAEWGNTQAGQDSCQPGLPGPEVLPGSDSTAGREPPGTGLSGAVTPGLASELQRDPALEKLRELAGHSAANPLGEDCRDRSLWEKGFLCREWAAQGEVELWGIRRQPVRPQKYHHRLLHLAQGKEEDPWRSLPIREEPFQKVAMNRVGPLSRATRSGKKYILVVVDFATRYPEAVPLFSIEGDTVANALLTIFSRVGFPKEVLIDQGSNFMSALLRCLWEKCGVRHSWASAYHPQSNGLVERFHGMLKMMLKTFMNRHPQDWDKAGDRPQRLWAPASPGLPSVGSTNPSPSTRVAPAGAPSTRCPLPGGSS